MADGELRLPLTVRNATLRAHAGEVSLPGGAVEEADASREATALRETREEIGVAPDGVTILGALDDVWIPVTNFSLRPFVGALPARPEMTPQTDEVALIVELPLRDLLHDGAITDEIVHGPDWTLGSAATAPRASWSGAPPPARWPCSPASCSQA